MASDHEYLEFILEQLSELEDISYRAMMGNLLFITKVKSLAEYMITDSL